VNQIPRLRDAESKFLGRDYSEVEVDQVDDQHLDTPE
jgi:hypothetical protein